MKQSVTFTGNMTCADQGTVCSNYKNLYKITQSDKVLAGKVNL